MKRRKEIGLAVFITVLTLSAASLFILTMAAASPADSKLISLEASEKYAEKRIAMATENEDDLNIVSRGSAVGNMERTAIPNNDAATAIESEKGGSAAPEKEQTEAPAKEQAAASTGLAPKEKSAFPVKEEAVPIKKQIDPVKEQVAVPQPSPVKEQVAAQQPAPVKEVSQYEKDLDLLARLITAEAQGEPYMAKVAVGAVVMNRIKSGLWADSIKGVIYQNIDGYYQFTPVVNGWINKPAEPESIRAAKEAMSGVDPTNGAQFYYDDKVTNQWILSKPVSVQFGHMIYAF